MPGPAIKRIGFAIPITKVTNIANTLIQKGFVNRSFYFGFQLADLPEENIGERPKGVFVKLIQEKSPAEKAGLQKGDIIIAVENVKINNYKEMGKALFIAKDYIVGDEVEFVVLRNSKKIKLIMTLEAFKK